MQEVTSENLDHYGLVAAVCKDLGIAEKINKALGPGDPQRQVSAGISVVAMILNGLGFTNRRLYLTPQFFANKPVEKLLGKGIQASMLTAHTLGQTLDEISRYGVSKLFATVAFAIAVEQGLLSNRNHLDSTSMSVQGKYADDPEITTIAITHGYSKDHRPDLKQVMLSLVVNGPAEIPIWMEAQDGNSSDKDSFHKTIQNVRDFQGQLSVDTDFKWVADSALYSKTQLLSQNDYLWLCRVPETLKEAKILVHTPAEDIDWTVKENGYQIASFTSNYGDIAQRWLLVYSEQAYQREKKTFEKKVLKQQQKLEKELGRLKRDNFQCEADAIKAVKPLIKRYSLFSLSLKPQAIQQYPLSGRPKADSKRITVGYCLVGDAKPNQAAIDKALNAKGRFIIATNDLDTERLSDTQMLHEYKAQQAPERGFRFFKDPWFMVDSIFLKSAKRIEALMMVMTLCLLVYNVAQYKLRHSLEVNEDTLPNQLNKAVTNPTMRWIFQLMEGISIVRISSGLLQDPVQLVITNLTKLRKKIILLFGPTAASIYHLIPDTDDLGLAM